MPEEVRAGALDRALASLEWTLGSARQTAFSAGEWAGEPVGSGAFQYVTEGRVEVRVRSRRIALDTGDLLVLGPGHRHELHAVGDAVVISGFFDRDVPERQVMSLLPETVVVRGFAEHEPAMAELIVQTVCAPEIKRAGEAIICRQIATAVLSAAVRSWAEQGQAPERWLQRIDDPLVARAIDAMHADPGRGWTVEELARVATMSRSAFTEQFRAVVGTAPAAYLTSVRVRHGMKLLVQGSSISDVSQQLGYESETGFRRAFRRLTGTSPTSWRQEAAS